MPVAARPGNLKDPDVSHLFNKDDADKFVSLICSTQKIEEKSKMFRSPEAGAADWRMKMLAKNFGGNKETINTRNRSLRHPFRISVEFGFGIGGEIHSPHNTYECVCRYT